MDDLTRTMPETMRQLHRLEFDYADGDGIDFEPFDVFMSREETREWFRAWTGNHDVDVDDYLIFGQDGTGGYAAIWNIFANRSLLEQPIVFFGSEGELGVVASSFSDYLWVLASNHGPYEAVAYPDESRQENTGFVQFAETHAATARESLQTIRHRAQREFPDFENKITALCQ